MRRSNDTVASGAPRGWLSALCGALCSAYLAAPVGPLALGTLGVSSLLVGCEDGDFEEAGEEFEDEMDDATDER